MGDSIEISVDGLTTVLGNLGTVTTSMASQVKKAVKDAAKECYEQSQIDCPVGKDAYGVIGGHVHYEHIGGSLKGSGKIRYPGVPDGQIVAEVRYGGTSSTGAKVEYPWYVEQGTSRMKAQPFLFPNFVHASRLLQIDLAGILRESQIK